MAAGFEVRPDDLDTFSTNLQSLVDSLSESKDVLNGVHFDPLVFGIIGQFFSIAARNKVAEAKEVIGKYETALSTAKDNTKLTAESYRITDQGNADTFKG
ncbi:type VII secretion target [Umezawaea sp.]|uniref:type VII secretion target n=1 Tax=Umezawaea sp. TaxID=1955258 RepID=UPI002ED087AA